MTAINLLHELEIENRLATPEEQEILSRYVGWGGLSMADVYKRQSEGYLLDRTIHKVGTEPELYTVEFNSTSNDVNEQVIKGNIAIIKHLSLIHI